MFLLDVRRGGRVDPEALTPSAAAIQKAGGILATVSFGTEEGGPVPAVPIRAGLTGSVARDRASGTRASPPFLRQPPSPAGTRGGRRGSVRLGSESGEVAALLAWLEEALGESEVVGTSREGVDRWSWLILISLLALGVEASLVGPLERPKVRPWA